MREDRFNRRMSALAGTADRERDLLLVLLKAAETRASGEVADRARRLAGVARRSKIELKTEVRCRYQWRPGERLRARMKAVGDRPSFTQRIDWLFVSDSMVVAVENKITKKLGDFSPDQVRLYHECLMRARTWSGRP